MTLHPRHACYSAFTKQLYARCAQPQRRKVSLALVSPAEPSATSDMFAFLEAYPDAIAIHRAGTLLYVNRAGFPGDSLL